MCLKNLCSLKGRWVSDDGVYIDIQKQTKNMVQGILYFKTSFIYQSGFSGIICEEEGRVNFVSFPDLHIPKLYTMVLHGMASKIEPEVREISLCICIFHSKNIDNINQHNLILTRTNKMVDEFSLKASPFAADALKDQEFLHS